MHETFWTLLCDAAHWKFEIFVMVLFDGVIIGLWERIRRRREHRIENSHTYHYTIETPKGICADCGGVIKHLIESGVKLCLGCGNIDVLK